MKEKSKIIKGRRITIVEKLKENKGITLIALVITIIVLLILAGVSIAMLTGENGILSQAAKAKEETEKAQANEAAILDEYNKYLNNAIGGTAGGGTTPPEEPEEPEDEGFFEENGTINGGEGTAMNPTIPEGFKPVDENGAEWGDGTNPPLEEDVNSGLIIEDKQGNQFVWVPVTGNYERNLNYPSFYDEKLDYTPENSTYTDTGYLPKGIQPETDDSTNNENAEKAAVLAKGGFYISRYEAGKEGESTLVSKKGATVWNEISQEECKTTAKTFINNENVKSALCSGIQWDMTMAFVNGKQDGTGNTYDVITYSNTRHTGSEAKLGQNEADRVCNIYDLEGNCWEYIAEKSSYGTYTPFVYRGGNYSSANPASNRYNSTGDGDTDVSFRFTLYVM